MGRRIEKISDLPCLPRYFFEDLNLVVSNCEAMLRGFDVCEIYNLMKKLGLSPDKLEVSLAGEAQDVVDKYSKMSFNSIGRDVKWYQTEIKRILSNLNHIVSNEMTNCYFTYENLRDDLDFKFVKGLPEFMDKLRYVAFQQLCFWEKQDVEKRRFNLFYKPFYGMHFYDRQKEFMDSCVKEEKYLETLYLIFPKAANYYSKNIKAVSSGMLTVSENEANDLTLL